MKEVNPEATPYTDARHLSGVQLALMGVELLNKYDLALRCMACGQIWNAPMDSQGKLMAGYWICPQRCNQ